MNEEDTTRSIPSVSFLFKVVPTYSVCLVCLKFPVVRWHLETMKLKKKESTIVYLCSSQGAGKTLQVLICLVKELFRRTKDLTTNSVIYTRPLTEKINQCEKARAEGILLFMKPLFVCCSRLSSRSCCHGYQGFLWSFLNNCWTLLLSTRMLINIRVILVEIWH